MSLRVLRFIGGSFLENSIGRRVAAALLAIAGSFSFAQAQQNLSWDINGASAGTGGTGIWNTTSPFWFNGATFQTWNNAAFDNAVFAGTAGNVTLGTPISVHNLTFNVGGYLFPSIGTTALAFGGSTLLFRLTSA